jgi:hypothetical protein
MQERGSGSDEDQEAPGQAGTSGDERGEQGESEYTDFQLNVHFCLVSNDQLLASKFAASLN